MIKVIYSVNETRVARLDAEDEEQLRLCMMDNECTVEEALEMLIEDGDLDLDYDSDALDCDFPEIINIEGFSED